MSMPTSRTAPQLILTIGLPGSGKTTRARQWVADTPGIRANGVPVADRVRVNRDDLRAMMFGGWTGQREHEDAVTAAQHAALRALLGAGISVVADDTNLHRKSVEALSEIGWACGATVGIWDMTNVPVDTCIQRDAERAARGERYVGEAVIRDIWARYQHLPGSPDRSGPGREDRKTGPRRRR